MIENNYPPSSTTITINPPSLRLKALLRRTVLQIFLMIPESLGAWSVSPSFAGKVRLVRKTKIAFDLLSIQDFVPVKP